MNPQLSFWKRLFGRGVLQRDAHNPKAGAERRQPSATGGPLGAGAGKPGSETPAGTLKALRASRREQLFALVRENMVRAGVLPSAYKFKILTLDRQALDFIVLCDIQPSAFDSHPNVLAKLESSLKELAHERMNVGVRSVYWRHAEVIARSHHSAKPPAAAPAASEDAVTEDEVLALKRALHAAQPGNTGVARGAVAHVAHSAPAASSASSASPASPASTAPLASAVPAGPAAPPKAASPAVAKASISSGNVPEWKRRDFAPTQPMADDEDDSLYMPLSETQLGRLD